MLYLQAIYEAESDLTCTFSAGEFWGPLDASLRSETGGLILVYLKTYCPEEGRTDGKEREKLRVKTKRACGRKPERKKDVTDQLSHNKVERERAKEWVSHEQGEVLLHSSNRTFLCYFGFCDSPLFVRM